jgi:hypothetical protein
MTAQSNRTPNVEVIEAESGLALAEAARLYLRSSRVGEPWRAGASNRFLLALADGVPVAVGEVRAMLFDKVGVDRFRSAPGTDAEGLRAHMTDFLGSASTVGQNNVHSLAA